MVIMQIQSGASRQALNYQQIRDFNILVPNIDVQRRIVDEIEAERKLVEANRKLIEIYERKIQAKLAEIWGEEKND
jgi:type I restriction enzyme M protein